MKKAALIVLTTLMLGTTIQEAYAREALPKPPQESREELFHDLFISLLLPSIDKAVNEYYSLYLTTSPTVYGYMIDVVKAEREYGYRSFKFLVSLEVTPVVGPHISVGRDRLTFDIGAGSPPKILKYEHLETHELPEHWQDIKRK